MIMSHAILSYSGSLDDSFTNTQPAIILTGSDDQDNWELSIAFFSRLAAYVIVLVTFAVVILLVKLLTGGCHDEATRVQRAACESDPLLTKTTTFTYGTCNEEEDLESGKCSSSTSSEDLYNNEICIVCYAQRRSCFFVPCGHCVTCSVCAQRIIDGENKNCIICRRLIGKVRKMIS